MEARTKFEVGDFVIINRSNCTDRYIKKVIKDIPPDQVFIVWMAPEKDNPKWVFRECIFFSYL